MEADLARIEATLLALSNDVRGDISRLEGQLEARVSLSTQHETVARLHERIDSLADSLGDLRQGVLNAQRLSVGTLITVLAAVLAVLYAGPPG